MLSYVLRNIKQHRNFFNSYANKPKSSTQVNHVIWRVGTRCLPTTTICRCSKAPTMRPKTDLTLKILWFVQVDYRYFTSAVHHCRKHTLDCFASEEHFGMIANGQNCRSVCRYPTPFSWNIANASCQMNSQWECKEFSVLNQTPLSFLFNVSTVTVLTTWNFLCHFTHC